MKYELAAPATLQEATVYFADAQISHDFLVALRWPDGVSCPHCNYANVSYISTRRIWKCKGCRKQFSVKVGTIFEDSALGLDKWLLALWLLANAKNGISSYEVHRALGVTQKTAWFMLGRIRLAMQTQSFKRFDSVVEADETFIGGLSKNMHKSKRRRVITGTGGKGKAVVAGLLKRGKRGKSRVKAAVVPFARREYIQPKLYAGVELGAEVFTDEGKAYRGLNPDFQHQAVNHAVRYVEGKVHVNGMENFWALLKRGIKGTYVSVDPFHLFRYVDEQVFRFNEREQTDCGRFVKVVRDIIGKRLTYRDLIGADLSPATT